MSETYDVIVIGGGPAGYPAAIRAAQLGMKAACIDAWLNRDKTPAFGGTCLNAGCIPSKALLESSEVYHRSLHEFATHGVKIGDVQLDLAQMLKRKDTISRSLTSGIKALFASNKVTGLFGTGSLLGNGQVEFKGHDGKTQTFSGKHIIIASGSEPVNLRVAPFDGDRIVDSWGALEFSEVPKRLGVIGAGVIGVELGSVWSRLGAKTVLLEALPNFLPMVDVQIAKEAQRQLTKQGLDIRLNAKVTGARVTGAGVGKTAVMVEFEQDGKPQREEFDRLIVAVGRKPYTRDLGIEKAGVVLDERGFIKVDDHYRTSAPGIFAVGDVIGGAMLAHKGIEEGVALAEQLAGHHTQVNYNAVPSVIYTAPEVAWVGKSEEQAKAAGFEVKTGVSSFAASGRAKALEQAVGIVKVISDIKTDRILGVHMVGPYVSELIAESVLALEYAATTEDIALTMHAHPTLSETFHDAILLVDGRAIHSINKPPKK